MKIIVVGAGSTYTPELVSGLAAQRRHLAVDELVLHDLDAERLHVVGGLAQRMLRAQGLDDVRTTLTTDRAEAVEGADAVLIQLRVGGQAARGRDEAFPAECGCIGQETTGAGGAAKALRTVPVVLDIAEEVARRANPGAWIVDFTNPVGIVTRALLDAGHRAVGLCNYAIGVQRWASRLLGVAPGRITVDPVGLNHFSWMRRILLDGVDVLPGLLHDRLDEVLDMYEFPAELVQLLGAIPSSYLQYYYFHDERVAAQRTSTPRSAVVAQLEAELLEAYRDPALVTKPPQLEQRGGAFYSEAAVELLASLLGDAPATHVVNVRNAGTIAGLADDDVIEVACAVGAGTIRPLPQAPVGELMLGPVQHVTAYERLTARAALTGDVDDLRRALLAHPLIGQWDLVQGLVPRLLETSAQHLPRFAKALEAQGVAPASYAAIR